MKTNPTDAEHMRYLAAHLKAELPNLDFALFVFSFESPGISNYISNAQRADMILAMEETLERFKCQQDFRTPEANDN